jgi:hypothetical protein
LPDLIITPLAAKVWMVFVHFIRKTL